VCKVARTAISGNVTRLAVFLFFEGSKDLMRNFKRLIVTSVVFAGALAAAGAAAEAGCINKGGRGTGPSRDSAAFQAWEAVLQATSWGSWAQFMASGMKVGSAPGYRVSNLRTSCKPGGMMGTECVVTASLCN
jgi:hypothetical protein